MIAVLLEALDNLERLISPIDFELRKLLEGGPGSGPRAGEPHPHTGHPSKAIADIASQSDKDAWMNRRFHRDALFDVGGKNEIQNGVRVTTVAPIPMVAELHPMDADYLSEVDGPEKKTLLKIGKTIGEHPQEFIFRNIRSEFGEQQNAFGVTGTGHAREAIDKVTGLLAGSMARHQHGVYYMTAAERSRAGLYRYLAAHIQQKTFGNYHAIDLNIPGQAASIALVRHDLVGQVGKILGRTGTEIAQR